MIYDLLDIMAGGIHPPISVITSWPSSAGASSAHSNGVLVVTVIFGSFAILTTLARL
ncbi:hypothetical protein BDV33DRAFT_185305 [Aspergillus novoparasiticus]|uniref:Uncharacterized protein n=1 Tax=Aspergillus novoparasiticus TaxID=986946 RepID=A0A5N6E9S4_9EURO|nr:hypothetical protein BDV33DRAFT_185305 [Aspergillus novoparasiticus]